MSDKGGSSTLEVTERSSVGRSLMTKACPPVPKLTNDIDAKTNEPTDVVCTARKNLSSSHSACHSELVGFVVGIQAVDTSKPRKNRGFSRISVRCPCSEVSVK